MKRLERIFQNLDTGMTREKYFMMMEQIGQEPKDHEIPPDWDDLPDVVVHAINIFNILGDRVYPEIGYVGKDYTNLELLIKAEGIEDVDFLMEVLHWLDARAIKKSSEQLKREYDKLKRKSSGSK